MARPLAKLSLVASLLSVASAIAIPTPVAKEFAKKDVQCAAAPALGYVTPSPGANVITVTQQGQPVSTCIPTAYACNADYAGCVTQYSTSSYNWYSTYIPCPTGLAYIDSGDCIVTLPHSTGPSYAVATYTATTPGVYDLGGSYYEVDQAPAYIQYVYETGNSYATCRADDYFQWLYGGYGDQSYATGGYAQYGSGQAGYGGLAVAVTTCDEYGCTTEYQNWSLGYSYSVETFVISGSFSGWCDGPGACVLWGFDARFGSISITINVNIGGAVTTVTSFTTTATVTSTVTNTVIVSGSSTISTITTNTAGATVTATISSTTTVAPTASSQAFQLQAIQAGTKKLRARQSQGFVGVINGGFSVVQSRADATTFFIQGGRLFDGPTAFAFASATDIAAGAAQVEVGTSASGASTLFDLNAQSFVLEWRNSQFPAVNARFCLQPNGEIFGVYSGVTPAGCLGVILVASPVAPVSSSSSSSSATSTTTGTSSTTSSSTGVSSTASSTSASSSIVSSSTGSSSASSSGSSSVSATSSGTSSSASSSSSVLATSTSSSSSSSFSMVSSTSASSSSSSSSSASLTSSSSSSSITSMSSSSSSSASSSSSSSSTSTTSAGPMCTAVDQTTNQVQNPGFEGASLTPWTESKTSAANVAQGVVSTGQRSGAQAYRVDVNTAGNSGTVQQTLTTCAGRAYSGSAYVNVGAGCSATIDVDGQGAGLQGPTSGTYTQVLYSFTAAGTSTTLSFTLGCASTTGSIYLDDVDVVDS